MRRREDVRRTPYEEALDKVGDASLDPKERMVAAYWSAPAGSTSRRLVRAQQALAAAGLDATCDEIWEAFRNSDRWPSSAEGRFEAMKKKEEP